MGRLSSGQRKLSSAGTTALCDHKNVSSRFFLTLQPRNGHNEAYVWPLLLSHDDSQMTEHGSEASFILPILIFLASAVVAVPLFRLIGLGAVIGYLAAGVAIGPYGLRFISNPTTTLDIAEFGVVLLLFIIGLELKPSRLFAMRRDIALLGSTQMVFTAAAISWVVGALFGLKPGGAVVAGIALAFSATAIAMQLLEERGDVQTPYGRRAFSVLLFQDMAVVPVLALIPFLANPADHAPDSVKEGLQSVSWSLAALAGVVVVGRYALNPLFRILAKSGAREVMTAAGLLVVLGSAMVMGWAGMSMALGAFLAGVLLSESNFRHQLEADIEPFRGLLMGLFFMSVGMSVNIPLVWANWQVLLGATLAVLAIKTILVFALFRVTGSTTAESLNAAGILTPAGEFAFVVFPLAASNNLMGSKAANLLTAFAALTMLMGPLIAKFTRRCAQKKGETPDAPLEDDLPVDVKGSVLVVGFGRFGQLAVQVLLAERVDVTVIDNSIERIRNAARFGFKVYYGDGTRVDVLRAAGAADARIIAICVDDKDAASLIVEVAKAQFPLAKLHARAYDRIHALSLYENGADFQVRETLESALAFGGYTLAELNGDPDRARDIVDAVRRRDSERLALQLAGEQPGSAYAKAQLRIEPEPLTKPAKKSRGLNQESQDIVDKQNTTTGTPAE